MTSDKSRWLYLQFPLLPLELCYTDRDPGPAALCESHGTTLLLCNAAADSQGVKPGIAIAAAVALCPSLQLFSRQPAAQEQAQLQALALWAGHFSARIAIRPPTGLLLEVASMANYFGSLKQLYQRLTQALNELAFSVTTAIGHTPECARLLALQGGFFSDDSAQLHQRLQQLPISLLKLPAVTVGQLQGMGIHQLEALLSLPRDALASRFGQPLLDYLDRLTGRQPDPPHYFVPPHRFCRRMPFDHELENSQALLFPLRRLLAELEGFLRTRQLQADQLQLCLGQREGKQQLCLSHSSGEYRQSVWLELWRLKLEALLLDQPVTSLQLSCQQLRPLSPSANDLFQATDKDSPHQLLNRLQTRLGHQAIYTPDLHPDHRPEHSHRYRSPDPDRLSGNHPQLVQSPVRLHRPSWLLQQPRPLNGTPAQCQITLLHGPERIVSGWWDQQPVRRDYYVGHWPDGRIGWLYRDDQHHWYQHGWFG